MAGNRSNVGAAALILGLLGLSSGCDQWRQNPPTPPPPPISFPTGDFVISTTADAEGGVVSLKTYDLSELLLARDALEADTTTGELLAAIRGCLPPDRTVELDGEQLSAELTEGEHADLERMLEDWRQGGMRQIVVEMRLLSPDVAAITPVAGAPVELRNSGSGGHPIFGSRIAEPQLVQLLTDVQGATRSNVLYVPKLTLLNGQRITVSDVVPRPFVASATPAVNGAVQPIVTTVDEGFRISIRPSTSGDGQIELSVDFSAVEIGEVRQVGLTLKNSDRPSSAITVQSPDVRETSTTAAVRLAAGESFLISVPGVPDPKQPKAPTFSSFFVLTPRLLPQEATSSVSAAPADLRR